MILDFDTYAELGGAITDEMIYARISARAESIIHRITHGRILNESPVRENVQYAAFDMIEAIYADMQNGTDGREIESMSNDGVSVNYVSNGGTAAQERTNRYAGIARPYLDFETDANGTPLLYAGVDA